MQHAIGISIHTGWAACVLVTGSLRKPEIVGNKVVELLDDPERFCFHRAAEMERAAVREWLEKVRAKALAHAKSELSPLLTEHVRVGAIVAKDGPLPDRSPARYRTKPRVQCLPRITARSNPSRSFLIKTSGSPNNISLLLNRINVIPASSQARAFNASFWRCLGLL
jgi:hypothetical protein